MTECRKGLPPKIFIGSRCDTGTEANNRGMVEMEAACAGAIGVDAADLAAFDRIEGEVAMDSRLFPVDPAAPEAGQRGRVRRSGLAPARSGR